MWRNGRRLYSVFMFPFVVWAGAVAVLLVPGFLLESLVRPASRGLLAASYPSPGVPSGPTSVRLAMAIAFGLAFWPVLFLWTSTAGLHWSPAAARVVLALLAIACGMVMRRRGSFRFRADSWADPWTWLTVALFALAAFTRVSQIGGVVLPLWVDSVHHTMIARLLIDQGSLPSSYAPFIPDSSFYYHWGFHAVVAFVAWITGLTAPIDVARLLLWLGQLLNALTFVPMYAAGRTLFASRRAGLLTAVFATLVSYFPAYYVSWGRYTHLAGLLLLAPLAIALWRASRRPSIANAIATAILSAGLILIHVRIAFFAATFAIVLLIVRRFRGAAIWAASALVAIALVSPWLVRLTGNDNVRRIMAPAASEKGRWETSNAVQDDLIWAPNNVPLMIAASGGLLGLTTLAPMTPGWRIAAIAWWLTLVIALQRRRASRGFGRRFALVAAWTALTALLVNSARLGLPPLRAVPNSAAIITFFVPLSLAAAGLASWFLDRVAPRHASRLTAIAAIVIAATGASTMLQVINPLTLLAREGDLRALAWIGRHTPPDAKFASGVQPWMAGSFVGVDGGYWIPVLTGRRSLLPPGLYTWVEPPEETARVNGVLAAWSSASSAGEALATLRGARVTHVYFGPASTSPMRSLLAATGAATPVYGEDGVTILRLR